MRIIHTSDWHLGQYFMGKSRESEHQAFLGWLLETVESEKADALIVAGDIFDTGTPPSYARAMYNRFIVSLRSTGCAQAVFTGGNHDSAATLEEARELLACLDTHVVGRLSQQAGDHVRLLRRRNGEPGALLCAVPFIRPRDLVRSRAGESGRDKQAALGDAISEFYTAVYEAAQAARDDAGGNLPGSLPILATGHLTLVGSRTSESVRDIYIGSLEAFPADRFPDFHYIAMGHLHRPQQVAGTGRIRYPGSPIPLSFDEAKREKQVLRVDIDAGDPAQVTPIPVPCFRTLATVSGDLDAIRDQIRDLPEPAADRTLWLEVEVETDGYLPDLQTRVGEMIGEQPAELLRIRRKRRAGESLFRSESAVKLEELNAEEVFVRRLDQAGEENRDRLLALFREIAAEIEAGA